MSAIMTERLVAISQQAQLLPKGSKTDFYIRHAADLRISVPTLHRKMKEVTVRPPRKRRNDAGKTSVTFDDAKLISGVVMEGVRRNGKPLLTVKDAMDMLFANGLINASYIDEDTGEMTMLSVSTVTRALRLYRLHPDQLNAPAPVTEMASKHPNWCWQIDPSLCVLYYLRAEKESDFGLKVMEADVFYKNKPKNIAKIEQERVWRYVITDHASGTVYVEYVLGAESGENLSNVFIHATQKRGAQDPFHGVPLHVMLDPGSANTGAVFKNLCHSLQVKVQINTPGNPRSKGQVEKMNDQVEKKFEGGLKFIKVNNLEELNRAAWNWMVVFNTTAIHSRTKQARYGVWMRITGEQLRTAPDEATCRELAHTAPESRKVAPNLTVSFKGDEYDVSTLPDVIVGQKVLVARNPWRPNAAQLVVTDAEGYEVFHVVEKIRRDDLGYREGAPVICESYSRHADTPAQRNAKDVEMRVMNASTLEEASAARKGKSLPFNGLIDPYKTVTDTVLPDYMPKRGTALEVSTIRTEFPPLSLVEFAKSMGGDWQASFAAVVSQRYPDGKIPAAEADSLKVRLLRGEQAPLTAVGGLK